MSFLSLRPASVAVAAVLAAGAMVWADEPVDFNDDIRPLLSDRCFACHGFDGKARKADLRLDTAEGALAGRDSAGPAIVAGDPAASLVWQRITAGDPDEIMPPPDFPRQLSAGEKELIRRWIAEGAVYEPHWTFVPVVRPVVVGGAGHPVDVLVAERLAQDGLEPAPEAGKRTLIRRLSLDLRGIPPSPGEVRDFLANDAPTAWDELVDRYLADPAFGERMAWPWLEAARYADTNGFQGDNERTMWPWRDWVVDAINRNLPYDEFTVWQIAGDLLPDATFGQKLATGFLRNHAINGEGGSIPEENRVNYVMDMAETVGTVWMGLTFNCCRCHDHKYDPLTQAEYYGLTDFFNQTPVTGGGGDPQTPPVLAAPTAEQQSREQALLREREALERQLPGEDSEAQGAWESSRRASNAPSAWQVLPPLRARAETQVLTIRDDGAVFAGGPNPDQDVYTVEFPAPAGPLAALRLDALQDPSMTRGGLARSDSGNFVLTGFEVALRAADGTATALAIQEAEATFEQRGFQIGGAVDEDPGTGWAVYDGKPFDRGHAAVFRFAAIVPPAPGGTLVVTLRHESPHLRHNLGCFRLSSSADPAAALPGDSPLQVALRVPPADRSQQQRQTVRAAYLASDLALAALQARLAQTDQELAGLRKNIPQVMVMEDRAERRPTHVLAVGSYESPGEEVTAHVPACLPPLAAPSPPNRLDLARWLVSREHPLTARVTVNRLWQELFGVGLVKTPEDFGVQSEIPVHPGVLDWLAAEFMESGWDYKKLVRNIVTSRTYRQSSRVSPELLARDPVNRLLARGPRFRRPSWMIRDQALAVGGLLVARQGGEPVKPWQPPGLWEEVTFGGGKKTYTPDTGEKLRRRSLYTFWRRISAPPMFFDSAKREGCEVGVIRTNSPLHALSTLNDPLYAEAARALAARAVADGAGDAPAEVLARAFELVLVRPPTLPERGILSADYEAARDLFAADPAGAEAFLSIGETPRTPGLDAVTHAALASVCLSILNTDEALTKE